MTRTTTWGYHRPVGWFGRLFRRGAWWPRTTPEPEPRPTFGYCAYCKRENYDPETEWCIREGDGGGTCNYVIVPGEPPTMLRFDAYCEIHDRHFGGRRYSDGSGEPPGCPECNPDRAPRPLPRRRPGVWREAEEDPFGDGGSTLKRCAACGHAHYPNIEWCDGCGLPLSDGAQPVRTAPSEDSQAERPWFCGECRRENPSSNCYCDYCGTAAP